MEEEHIINLLEDKQTTSYPVKCRVRRMGYTQFYASDYGQQCIPEDCKVWDQICIFSYSPLKTYIVDFNQSIHVEVTLKTYRRSHHLQKIQ